MPLSQDKRDKYNKLMSNNTKLIFLGVMLHREGFDEFKQANRNADKGMRRMEYNVWRLAHGMERS